VPFLYSLTLFCSAFLLFQIQPMVGKMLLPKLGGTPAVWNTCMVFFQAILLAGYAYAHATTRLLGPRRQTVLHALVLIVPAATLPIVFREDAFRSDAVVEQPVLLLLAQLTLAVGLPFFVISTTAPLLQRWFAETGHPSAKDPYFLYAASNSGSMLALLAYPALVEPLLPLDRQSLIWALGYGLCSLLIFLCAATLWNRRAPVVTVTPEPPPQAASEPLTWPRRLWWVALAFVPSSMLLGTTTYISTDIAPIPLLWIIPLALYLLTFILVFAKRPPLPHRLMNRMLPIAVLMLALVLLTGATELRGLPVWVLLAIHLLAFFLTAMVAHGELARDRPAARYLTEFYLWMSVGGVLGGMFNALVAPLIFRSTGLTEYPLALVLACLVRPVLDARAAGRKAAGFDSVLSEASDTSAGSESQDVVGASDNPRPHGRRLADFVLPLAVGALSLALLYLADYLHLGQGPLRTGLGFGLPCILVYTFVDRPLRFGLGVAGLLLAGALSPGDRPLYRERNFFGVVKVSDVDGGKFRALFHGNTIHGQMNLNETDPDGRRVPLTYYHPTGPIGVVCRRWFTDRPDHQVVGAVGLGTGSLAYYARPGDRWLFFEIDPAIQRVAEDPNYFTFMGECRAGKPEVILGDAYLRLQDVPEQSFDMLVLDAFSSDAIPVHLLTREAMQVYKARLKPGGMMAFHISNRYLNLRPILARLAEDAGLVARGWYDLADDKDLGKLGSEWVIMARSNDDFGPVLHPYGRDKRADPRWERIQPKPDTPLWTNNFSNLLSAFGREN
jgi:hypothetical protein